MTQKPVWREIATDPPPDDNIGFLAATMDTGEPDGIEWLRGAPGSDGRRWNVNSGNRTRFPATHWAPLPGRQPETIIACAIQIDVVMVIPPPSVGRDDFVSPNVYESVNDNAITRGINGYLTSLARFVTPDEARGIAERAGQDAGEWGM